MQDNLAYRDPVREELIDGKVVAMSPRPSVNHNWISDNITYIFKNHLRGKNCVPFSDGVDLHLSKKDIFVPDMMVVCDRNKIKRRGVYGTPDLVVEVLSPSTAGRDRGYKKDLYEASGVPEYWIVDPAARSIEVYLLSDGRYFLSGVYYFHTAEELEDLTEEEKDELAAEFKCHLYDDLVIRLEDIFGDLF